MKRLLDRAYYALDRHDQILSTIVVPHEKPRRYKALPTSQQTVPYDENSKNEYNSLENPSAEDRLQGENIGKWAVQLGAFTKAHAADLLLNRVLEIFPDELRHSIPQVVPIETEEGTLFRAKHVGLTQKLAKLVCSKLQRKAQPCIVVTP